MNSNLPLLALGDCASSLAGLRVEAGADARAQEIFDNILDRHIEWPAEEDLSLECRDLIERLLTTDTRQRLGHRGAGEVRRREPSPPHPGSQ